MAAAREACPEGNAAEEVPTRASNGRSRPTSTFTAAVTDREPSRESTSSHGPAQLPVRRRSTGTARAVSSATSHRLPSQLTVPMSEVRPVVRRSAIAASTSSSTGSGEACTAISPTTEPRTPTSSAPIAIRVIARADRGSWAKTMVRRGREDGMSTSVSAAAPVHARLGRRRGFSGCRTWLP